jgi:hypothetical protein
VCDAAGLYANTPTPGQTDGPTDDWFT